MPVVIMVIISKTINIIFILIIQLIINLINILKIIIAAPASLAATITPFLITSDSKLVYSSTLLL